MKQPTTINLTQFGLASLVPGAQYIVDEMQAVLDDIRTQLEGAQNGDRPKRGRPPKAKPETVRGFLSMRGLKPGTPEYKAVDAANHRIKRSGQLNTRGKPLAATGPWASMTPEERSAEMKRRQAVTKAKNRKSPAQTRWERMSKRQQKQFLAKMAAGRAAQAAAKKQQVNGATA